MNDSPKDRFDKAYEALADAGKTDSVGGAEYRRVLSEWQEAGSPVGGLTSFIVTRAAFWPFECGREDMN